MKALFANTRKELEAAAKAAGLKVLTLNMDNDQDCVAFFNKARGSIIENRFAAIGSNHAIMRLIGALANDGQDTLIEVEG